MRMKKTTMGDVPKGKRWSHFWFYYEKAFFLSIFLGGMLLYTLYLALVKPEADLSVMILSDQFSFQCEAALRETFNQWEQLDTNGDGNVRINLDYISFDTEPQELSLEQRMELMTILSSGNTNLFLANKDAMAWLASQGLLATQADGTPISIAVSHIPFFQNDDYTAIRDLTICFYIQNKVSLMTVLFDIFEVI